MSDAQMTAVHKLTLAAAPYCDMQVRDFHPAPDGSPRLIELPSSSTSFPISQNPAKADSALPCYRVVH